MRRTDLVGFALGPALNALLGLAVIPLMAWLYAPEDVARFGLFQLAINSLLLVATLGLDQAMVREFNETQDRSALLKNCLMPGLLFIGGLGLVALANVQSLTTLVYESPQASLGYLTIATALLLCTHRFAALLVRMRGRGLLYSAADLLTKLAQLALMTLALWFEPLRQAPFLMLAYLVAFLLSTTLLAMSERAAWRDALAAPLKLRAVKPLLAFGAPLVASGLAYWALTAAGSLFIKSVSTLGELAKYSVTISLSNAALLFQSIFVLVWTPIVYQWIADGIRTAAIEPVARCVLAYVCLFFVLAGLACGFLDHLLPAHYAQIGQLLPGCLVLPLLYTLSEVTGIGIAITRRTSLAIVVSLAALIACVAVNLLLTARFGAVGAATASAVAGLAFFLTRSELSARVWQPLLRVRLYGCATLLTAVAILPAFRPDLTTPAFWLAAAALVVIAFRADFRRSIDWLRSFWAARAAAPGAHAS